MGNTQSALAVQSLLEIGQSERLRWRILNGNSDALLDQELIEYILTLVMPHQNIAPLAARGTALGQTIDGRGRCGGFSWLSHSGSVGRGCRKGYRQSG